MTRVRPLAAGLVAVLVAALLTACSGGTYKVTAIFDDIGDLQSRGSVQVADVRVGLVTTIKLTKDFRAEVTMQVNKGVKVPANSKAFIRTTSLLGEKFVELRPLGDPNTGPFIAAGHVYQLDQTGQAPELEFIAQEAVSVLGGVASNDLATLVQSGAEAFAGREAELKNLITDLSSISQNLAGRTGDITAILTRLDTAATTVAGGSGDIQRLLDNLATTTQVLSDNRQKAIDALASLSRLARDQNAILSKYRSDIDRQIKQVDVILQRVTASKDEVASLIDWIDQFTIGTPKVVQNDFTQVFAWVVPQAEDCRLNPKAVGCP